MVTIRTSVAVNCAAAWRRATQRSSGDVLGVAESEEGQLDPVTTGQRTANVRPTQLQTGHLEFGQMPEGPPSMGHY